MLVVRSGPRGCRVVCTSSQAVIPNMEGIKLPQRSTRGKRMREMINDEEVGYCVEL